LTSDLSIRYTQAFRKIENVLFRAGEALLKKLGTFQMTRKTFSPKHHRGSKIFLCQENTNPTNRGLWKVFWGIRGCGVSEAIYEGILEAAHMGHSLNGEEISSSLPHYEAHRGALYIFSS
jgi:hypothetical protein